MDDNKSKSSTGGGLEFTSVEAAMEVGRQVVADSLREKVSSLEREKAALADLLAAKKKEHDQMKQHYKERIGDLEDEVQRLKSEKIRLVDKLKLPESERSSLLAQENEIADLKRRLDDSECRCADMLDDNADLKQEVKDLQLEIEEMHDQFREEETIEFRELQKELETTAKNCRILQFKLRKTERRSEQLDAEKLQLEEKVKQLETRFQTSDDKQHIVELEEELRMAKEVSVRLHDELDGVEEKRTRYEEELDRVNDILTESETRRLTLQKEVEALSEQLLKYKDTPTSRTSGSKLTVPTIPSVGKMVKQGSQEIDVAQVMRDLSDSLEREADLKEQLKFSEEETRITRKKLSELEEENESLNLQLHKLSSAKSMKFYKKPGDVGGGEPEVITEREHELRLQMELAEQEVKVLRRKMNEMEKSYDVLLEEVKLMRVRVDGKDQHGAAAAAGDKTYEEKIQQLASDIEKLKFKLIKKDQAADQARCGGAATVTKGLKKSRSLEDSSASSDNSGGVQTHEYQLDLRRQLDTVQQEARVLKDKMSLLEQENERLQMENTRIHFKSSKHPTTKSGDDSDVTTAQATERARQLETENVELREKVRQLDERTSELSTEVVRVKFRGEALAESSAEWRELRAQTQSLHDECRALRRKTVDLEAVNAKLTLQVSLNRNELPAKESKRADALEAQPREQLKRRIIQLETELAGMTSMAHNREADNERLQEEVVENRDDMNRMLDAFRHRERELRDELDNAGHKNRMLSDLLDLVTERAESTQTQLDRCLRDMAGSSASGGKSGAVDGASGTGSASGTTAVPVGTATAAPSATSTTADVTATKELEKQLKTRIERLERLLADERMKVQAAEKKLRMTDVPLSEIKDDTKLRQHEKEILMQELALCQKQLKTSNDQITDLKDRLITIRESHEDIKADFNKVSRELERVREQQKEEQSKVQKKKEPVPEPKKTETVTEAKTAEVEDSKPVAPIDVDVNGRTTQRQPASWRWEKQEMERQLKDYKKKLDDIHAEMKRNQLKWKVAGEDIARETKIKEELEKKINKLKEDVDVYRKESEDWKNKLDELQEQLKKKEKQWEKERGMLVTDKNAAETDARQKDDVIRSKDDLLRQKNELIREKDQALRDRHEALLQKELLLQQRDTELEMKDREARNHSDEMAHYRAQVDLAQANLDEKDERIHLLDDHVRRRDDRLKEKDEILQQINRKLVEKENEVSDMDKTIRQVIKKLQAKDLELGACRLEVHRAQTDMKNAHEKSACELRKSIEALELDHRRQAADAKTRIDKLNADLVAARAERTGVEKNVQAAHDELRSCEEKWKRELAKTELELQQVQEKLHAAELVRTVGQTDAMKTLVGEKEALIVDKHRLADDVTRLKKQLNTLTMQWNVERDDMRKIIDEKTKMIEDNSTICDHMQQEIGRLKGGTKPTPGRLSLLIPSPTPTTTGFPDRFSSSLLTTSTTLGAQASPSDLDVDACRQMIADLRARLDQQSLAWKAEKATLEEFYEQNSRHLAESVRLLEDRVVALRHENDTQLQLLNSSRKMLADLRSRYDNGLMAWNQEKQVLERKIDQGEKNRTRITILEQSLEDTTRQLNTEVAKRNEIEAKLKAAESIWAAEKAMLEDRSKKTEDEPKSASTRVSDFRAKLEKFGSTKSTKKGSAAEVDSRISEVTRDLRYQLEQVERVREVEKKELTDKLNKHLAECERERRELSNRNTNLEKKAREISAVQKSLTDVQYGMMEEREHWALERAQLQEQFEDSRKSYLLERENINQLLSEVKRLRVLASGLDSHGASPSVEGKQRLRSLTPSAERIRISNLSLYSRTGDRRNGGTPDSGVTLSTKDDAWRRTIDQPMLQDLVQAIENASKMAEEVSQPKTEKRDPLRPLTLSGIRRVEVNSEGELAAEPSGRGRSYQRSSSQEEEQQSSSQDRLGIARPALRGSVYVSGTQSAYASREASPDKSKGGVRKVSPYPAAPPSMIITPSHTPHRAQSVERSEPGLDSETIQSLYDKLSAMQEDSRNAAAAVVAAASLSRDRSTNASMTRVLTKSVSADASSEAIHWSLNEPPAAAASLYFTASQTPSSNAATLSIPVGQRSASVAPDISSNVTPAAAAGDSKTSRKGKMREKRSASVSPRTARRQFYEDHARDTSNSFTQIPDLLGRPIVETAAGQSSKKSTESLSGGARSASDDRSRSTTSKLSAAATSFFQNVKEKRRLFGTKKSSSADNSAVHASIAQIGTSVLTEPAAPSNYEPPTIPLPDRTPIHRRTVSVDNTTVYSTAVPTTTVAESSTSSQRHASSAAPTTTSMFGKRK